MNTPLIEKRVQQAPMDPVPPPTQPDQEDPLLSLSKPTGWAVTTVTAQPDLLSLIFHSRFARSAASSLRRLAFSLLCLTYAAASLLIIISLALLLAAFLVRLFLDEPLLLRRPLHLNYTNPHPDALAALGISIPSGHTVTVSLRFLIPESEFNRHVGIFQVSTAAVSSNDRVVEFSTRPVMLVYRSLPVRLMRTFAMAAPLLLGIRTETQELGFEALRYGEGDSKTKAIRVWVTPRAGTMDLPQIYEAEMIIRTHLPRTKEVVYKWKWTFYLWVSTNLFVLLLGLVLCCFRPLGIMRGSWVRDQARSSEELGDSLGLGSKVAGDVSGELSEDDDDGQIEASESSVCE